MSDKINIDAPVLHQVADGHDEVAGHIETARGRSADIIAAVQSFGPIMHPVKTAVAELMSQRDDALGEHRDHHVNTAFALRRSAATFTDTDEGSGENIAGIIDA
jgi:hypothetical protein